MLIFLNEHVFYWVVNMATVHIGALNSPVDSRRKISSSSWRQNDVALSFSCHNDVIIEPCARGGHLNNTMMKWRKYVHVSPPAGSVKRIFQLHCLFSFKWSHGHRADSRFAPRQWKTALLCNDVSHWLGASLESTVWSIWRLRMGTLSALTLQWRHIAPWCVVSPAIPLSVQLFVRTAKKTPKLRVTGSLWLLVDLPHKGPITLKCFHVANASMILWFAPSYVLGIHRLAVDSTKGKWCGALIVSFLVVKLRISFGHAVELRMKWNAFNPHMMWWRVCRSYFPLLVCNFTQRRSLGHWNMSKLFAVL